jgi:Arc/MetJ-type ribon-helix-helix transcriptional regulator
MDKTEKFPRGGKDWQNITINVTPELKARIEAQQWAERMTSRADFLRKAVEFYLREQGKEKAAA